MSKTNGVKLAHIYRSLGVGYFTKLGCLPVFQNEQPAVDLSDSKPALANFCKGRQHHDLAHYSQHRVFVLNPKAVDDGDDDYDDDDDDDDDNDDDDNDDDNNNDD